MFLYSLDGHPVIGLSPPLDIDDVALPQLVEEVQRLKDEFARHMQTRKEHASDMSSKILLNVCAA